jgi:molybdate transport system substrate-binding protein
MAGRYRMLRRWVLIALLTTCSFVVEAADLKVLTTGAMKPVVLDMVPAIEKQGHTVKVENDTAGALLKRIEAGETFDVAVITPGAINQLIKSGKVTDGTGRTLARVGIGVMVREGAPRPDISSVAAFKTALLAAKTIGFIDPASGGSSGIYLTKLFETLGVADAVQAKAKLKKGGYVADLVTSGEAELGIHQISEIVPVKGVTLIGPLPSEIQNYTTYAGGIGSATKDVAAARALLDVLSSADAVALLTQKGMERPAP